MEQFAAASLKVSFFVSVKVISIFCEFTLNPKKVISCFGKNIDLSGSIIIPSKFKSFIDAIQDNRHPSHPVKPNNILE